MGNTASQQKYLKERLSDISRSKPSRYQEIDFPETPAVKKAKLKIESAKKVIADYEDRRGKVVADRAVAINKMKSDCERAIHFGTPEEALKALDKFESAKF